jgi:ammonium transporter, Amt family
LKITDLISPMTVSSEEKLVGSDFSQHGENLHPYESPKEAAAA